MAKGTKKPFVFEWNGEEFKKILHLGMTEKMIVGLERIRETAVRSFHHGRGETRDVLHVRTGRLMGSISTNWTGSGKQMGDVRGAAKGANIKGVGNPGGKFPEIQGVVGTNVIYGKINEYGGITGRGYTSVIPPRPYLRPAIDKNLSQIRKLFGSLKDLKGKK